MGIPATTDQLRLEPLHGLRGLLALWVVSFHLVSNTHWPRAPVVVREINGILRHGHLAVPLFLVLSGFLLARPVVVSGGLRGGLGGYLRRRAWRLLPPYYVAWAGTVGGICAVAWILSAAGRSLAPQIDAHVQRFCRRESIVSHLLLVSNCVPSAVSVFWAISCEVQIGLLFGLVLVPAWRARGLTAAVAIATALGAAGTAAVEAGFHYLTPWLLPCFALGMVAAQIACGEGRRSGAARAWHWGRLVTGLAIAAGVAIATLEHVFAPSPGAGGPPPYFAIPPRLRWVPDLLTSATGAAVCVWIVADRSRGMAHGLVVKALQARVPVFLGVCGYSLYLTHILPVVVTLRACAVLQPWAGMHWAMVMLVGTASSILLAAVFWRWCEWPSMMTSTRRIFATDPGVGGTPQPPADR